MGLRSLVGPHVGAAGIAAKPAPTNALIRDADFFAGHVIARFHIAREAF